MILIAVLFNSNEKLLLLTSPKERTKNLTSITFYSKCCKKHPR